jgi:hypothetical protein
MKKCPKCGYERKSTDTGGEGVCPACGLVFAKWAGHTLGTARLPRERDEPHAQDEAGGRVGALLARLTFVEPRTDPMIFWGRVAVFSVLFVWGWYFIFLNYRSAEIMGSFLHRVDLVFHEAGHVFFMPFGAFMAILGGTLGQLIMPVVVIVALIVTSNDTFGASVGLWWLGQSFMDCAPYIADARALQLQLVGGGTGADRPGMHDWENILLDLNMIQHDTKIAAVVHAFGALVMLVAFAWGAYLLLQQYRNLEAAD